MVTTRRDPLTVIQAAQRASVSTQTIMRAIRSGTLEARKIGWQWVIEKEALKRWMQSR